MVTSLTFRGVIGHVTVLFLICHILLVLWNQASVTQWLIWQCSYMGLLYSPLNKGQGHSGTSWFPVCNFL